MIAACPVCDLCMYMQNTVYVDSAGAYRAGEAGEGACNSVLVSVYGEIQTWLSILKIAIPFRLLWNKLMMNPEKHDRIRTA